VRVRSPAQTRTSAVSAIDEWFYHSAFYCLRESISTEAPLRLSDMQTHSLGWLIMHRRVAASIIDNYLLLLFYVGNFH
jgi:hypothetical protein